MTLIKGSRNLIEVYCSFAQEDMSLCIEILEQLQTLENAGTISINNTYNTKSEEGNGLNTADIILLMISAAYLASDYLYEAEMKRALERQAAREAVIVPIILRPCDWARESFSRFQVLPRNTKPIIQWSNPKDAFKEIVEEIQNLSNILFSNIEINIYENSTESIRIIFDKR